MKVVSQLITSRKNPQVLETASLHEKKHREEAGAFLLEGEKLVYEAADRGLPLVSVFVAQTKREEIIAKLSPHFDSAQYADLPLYTLSDDCFEKISSEKSPQGVIAVAKYLDFFKRSAIIDDVNFFAKQGKRLTILAGIQDPGNLGAVIRSAVAFGTDVLLLDRNCADLYHSRTVRAAMGSFFSIQALVFDDLKGAVSALQNCKRRVLAAELRPGAVSVEKAALKKEDCVIIGNEGHGIPKDLSALCDASVFLPITPHAESLNAAVAASILLWEQSKS